MLENNNHKTNKINKNPTSCISHSQRSTQISTASKCPGSFFPSRSWQSLLRSIYRQPFGSFSFLQSIYWPIQFTPTTFNVAITRPHRLGLSFQTWHRLRCHHQPWIVFLVLLTTSSKGSKCWCLREPTPLLMDCQTVLSFIFSQNCMA